MGLEVFDNFNAKGPYATEGDIGDYGKVLTAEVKRGGIGYPPRMASLLPPGSKLRVSQDVAPAVMQVIKHAEMIGLPFICENDLVYAEKYGAAMFKYPNMPKFFWMHAERAGDVCRELGQDTDQHVQATLLLELKDRAARFWQQHPKVSIPSTYVIDQPPPDREPYLQDAARQIVYFFGGDCWIAKLSRTASGCEHKTGTTVEDAYAALQNFVRWQSAGVFQRMVGDHETSLCYWITPEGWKFGYSTDQIMVQGAGGNFVHDGNYGGSEFEELCRTQGGGDYAAKLAWELGYVGPLGKDFQVASVDRIAWKTEDNARVPGSLYAMSLAHRAGLTASQAGVRNVRVPGTFSSIEDVLPREYWLNLSTGKGAFCLNPNAADKMATIAYFGTREEQQALHAELVERQQRAAA